MSELEKISGLSFEIGKDKLIYKKEEYQPAIDWDKTFEAGKYAYKEPNSDLGVLYYGARYMEKTHDEEIFIKNNFMFDLTIFNHGLVGDEIIKTVGHYHQNVPNTDIAYPEIYEAISKNIEYLLQTEPDKDGAVDVIWVVTEPGDKVVMAPGYGHVSMNVGDGIGVEVDLQLRDNPNGSDYSIFKEKNGGALIRTKKGLEENPNYKIKSLRIVKPKEKPEWGIVKDKPLYISFIESPEKFDWLIHPQNYQFDLNELFEDIEL
jgi:glucose-6-phosphate isomerase